MTIRFPREDLRDEVIDAVWTRLCLEPDRLARMKTSYVLKLAVQRELIDRLRTLARRQRLGQAMEAIIPPLSGYDGSLGSNETRLARLSEVLVGLDPEQQRLIELRFWEGRSIQSIAEQLGVSYSTAAVRIFRLLAKLRDLLGAV